MWERGQTNLCFRFSLIENSIFVLRILSNPTTFLKNLCRGISLRKTELTSILEHFKGLLNYAFWKQVRSSDVNQTTQCYITPVHIDHDEGNINETGFLIIIMQRIIFQLSKHSHIHRSL